MPGPDGKLTQEEYFELFPEQREALDAVLEGSTVLTPGLYYLALVMDNTTGTGFRTSLGNYPGTAAGAPAAAPRRQ